MPGKYFNHQYKIDNDGFTPIKESKPYKEMLKNSRNHNNDKNSVKNIFVKYSFLSILCIYSYYDFVL